MISHQSAKRGDCTYYWLTSDVMTLELIFGHNNDLIDARLYDHTIVVIDAASITWLDIPGRVRHIMLALSALAVTAQNMVDPTFEPQKERKWDSPS